MPIISNSNFYFQYIREMEVIDKKHDAEIALLRSKVEQQYREDS